MQAIDAKERRYQQQERRARLMEVRQEAIHATDFLSRIDIDVCIAIEGGNPDTIRGIPCRRFQCAETGGPDRDDASGARIDLVGSFLCHVDVFRVHRVFGDVIRALDRPEGPETNGEEYAGGFDAICCESVKELCGEVQSCGGRCGASGDPVVDRLVALTIIEVFVDIRWEWDAALCFEGLAQHLRVALKVEDTDAFCEDIPDGTREVGVCEVECVSGACSLPWAYEGFVGGWPAGEVGPQHKRFPVTSAWAFPDKAYSTHTCFIDDQEVSGFQELGDLVKDDVRVGATARVDMQKPRGVARLKRCLRDAVIREDVIKRI